MEHFEANEITCPYCKRPALWCENKEVYGRNFGESYMCYYCGDCDAYVGCHNNSKRPLGTMANRELRELRMKTHKHIDAFWKSGRMTRKRMYKKLADIFGKEVHVGQSDEEMCEKLLQTNL